MFSKTEMFLSDQFLSTCWKCCCFWTPMSWCSPIQPHADPSELAWTQVLLISFNWSISKVSAPHSTPCWSFSPPKAPVTLVLWKGQLRDDKPMKMKWLFSVSLLFLVNRNSWEPETVWPKGCLSSLRGRCALTAALSQQVSPWLCPGEAHTLGDFSHSQEVLKQTVLRPLRVGRAEGTACSGWEGTPCVLCSHTRCTCANGAGTEAFLHCSFESTSARQINALEEVQPWIEHVLCPKVRATCSEATSAERAILNRQSGVAEHGHAVEAWEHHLSSCFWALGFT